ncbi:LysR family transcriptional regulator [Paraburkholderia sp. RAU2J]|uniref:LysR family transcriptional regulator n=1 Tax=Paraburkholderia sp. RAU2J TaxID=1938810 RepID=UPI000EB22035|nr:LysR family transcriptional regulator [Paraburkholderia sp. RAU2J]RKT10315.1 LysR family transcriptional regulator [Paraburkholderia sp. RAU2J]
MDRVLHAMSVFTHVVRRGSFTAAAGSLGITAASASTLVRQLEARLDVMLLQRSTRSMSLTAEGSQYYKHCVAILSEMREMEEHLSGASRLVRGRLSVEVDQEAGSVLLPTLVEFRSLHTQLDLRIEVGGEGERLIDQGIDCAIVIGHLRDSSLQCKRVGSYQAVTVASPAYLRKNGVPRQVANLHDHEFVHYAPRRSGGARHPRFNGEAGTQTLRLAERTVVGDVHTVVNYATRGLGLAQVGLPLVSRLIEAGELVELLAYARPAALPIVAIYPQRRHVPMSLRAFIEWATSRFETDMPTRSQQTSIDASEWNPSREIGHAAAA